MELGRAYQIAVKSIYRIVIRSAKICRNHEWWIFIITISFFSLTIFIPFQTVPESLYPVFIPVVPWLFLVALYKTPYKRNVPILRGALWYSTFMFFLGGIGISYWTTFRLEDGTLHSYASSQFGLAFANGTLDRSSQAFLVGVVLGPIMCGLAPFVIDRYDLWKRSAAPSSDIRSSALDRAMFDLVTASLRYGALPLAIIYANIWPHRLLICEPSGFPEIASAFVGLMFMTTVVAALLRFSNPYGSFAKAVKDFFRWPELPRSIMSVVTSLLAIWAVAGTAYTYWSDCVVKTATGSVFQLFLLSFAQFSILTMGPAFCAIVGSSFLIEILAEAYRNVSPRRKQASFAVALAGLLTGILLPFFTDFTELIVMTTRVPISSFSWMVFAYNYGPDLLIVIASIAAGLVLWLYKRLRTGSDVVAVTIGILIGLTMVASASSSSGYFALSGNRWGPTWVPFMTVLNFVVLSLTISWKKEANSSSFRGLT